MSTPPPMPLWYQSWAETVREPAFVHVCIPLPADFLPHPSFAAAPETPTYDSSALIHCLAANWMAMTRYAPIVSPEAGGRIPRALRNRIVAMEKAEIKGYVDLAHNMLEEHQRRMAHIRGVLEREVEAWAAEEARRAAEAEARQAAEAQAREAAEAWAREAAEAQAREAAEVEAREAAEVEARERVRAARMHMLVCAQAQMAVEAQTTVQAQARARGGRNVQAESGNDTGPSEGRRAAQPAGRGQQAYSDNGVYGHELPHSQPYGGPDVRYYAQHPYANQYANQPAVASQHDNNGQPNRHPYAYGPRVTQPPASRQYDCRLPPPNTSGAASGRPAPPWPR